MLVSNSRAKQNKCYGVIVDWKQYPYHIVTDFGN